MAFLDPNKPFIASEIATGTSGERIRIFENDIEMYTGHADETQPGKITTNASGNTLSVVYQSPEVTGFPGQHANLSMETLTDGTHSFDVDATRSRFFTTDLFQVGSPFIKLGDSTANFDLVIEADATNTKTIIRNEDEVWHGTADTALAGTWVDTAGARFGYYKEATGRVQLRGLVRNGGAVTIVTLPVGYRPTSNLDFTVQNKTTGGIASIGVNTAGVVQISTNFVAGTMQVYLDAISFPTF